MKEQNKIENKLHENIELRSEEFQEIIGRIPNVFERRGIIVMFCVVVVMLIGCYFFKYPDTLDAKISITNTTPAVNVVAHATGKLEKLVITNGSVVTANDTLAIIQNTARTPDIQRLRVMLSEWLHGEIDIVQLNSWMNKRTLQLGEIQSVYSEFQKDVMNYINYRQQHYYPQKIAMKLRMIGKRHELEEKMHDEHKLGKQQEGLSASIFCRDSLLHEKNIMTGEDYDKSRQSFLQSKQTILNQKTSEKQMDMQKMEEEETLLDLKQQYIQSKNEYALALHTSIEALITALKSWEQNYVLKASITGHVNMMGIWSSHQNVSNGDVVFVVMPLKMARPIGKALLPASGAGKVKKGQKVIVSVNNFPDEEFGNLQGVVNNVSNIPTAEGTYLVDIRFPNGLTTIYNKKLPPSQQMFGDAKIIIKNRRLTDLFIQPIKKILKNQEVEVY